MIEIDALKIICILLTYPDDFIGAEDFIQTLLAQVKNNSPKVLDDFLNKRSILNSLYPNALNRIQKFLKWQRRILCVKELIELSKKGERIKM